MNGLLKRLIHILHGPGLPHSTKYQVSIQDHRLMGSPSKWFRTAAQLLWRYKTYVTGFGWFEFFHAETDPTRLCVSMPAFNVCHCKIP